MIKRLLLASTFLALLAGTALAQSVQQSGTVTRGHLPYWVSTGVIGDGGTSADSPVTSIGVTNEGGAGLCVNSQRQSAAGRNALCLSTSTTGAATISLQNYGTAAAQALQFVINGTTYPFPGSLANITIGTTPVVGGSTGQCLYVAAGLVGQQNCTLSAITSLTGDVTGTGPGITAATLATVNPNTGTFGSGSLVPVVTVNGKGLITAISTSALAVAVGSTSISSGTTNGLLYNNAGTLGNLSTQANGVLVTSAGGIPSIATTLPTALTMPTPTFTGTMTMPDAATWNSSGLSKAAALSVGSATLPSGGNVSISGQYQVNGTQIAASNLSNGVTGSGAVVLATSPTMLGTWAGSPTLSGNITHSGQLIATGTSAPASAAGNTVVMGTLAAPTLTNTGQAFLYNTLVSGAILQGDGSTNDVTFFNKNGGTVFGIPTGTTKLNFPSLSAGTCSSGLALDSSNNTILVSCPGAAASIQVGTTTVTSGTTLNILYNNAGTLGNNTIASFLTAGTGISVTGTTNATIATSLSTASNFSGGNVSLNNTTFTDGPSAAQGTSGTWFCSGTVTVLDTAGSQFMLAKLYDGTTTIASAASQTVGANTDMSITMSGVITSPAGNVRIAVKSQAAATSSIRFNDSGLSKDSGVTCVRIG